MRLRRPLTVAIAAAAFTVVVLQPAGAHPFFAEDGGSAPAGSLATLTLAMAHGCGAEEDADGEPTLEVAMEVPERFSYLEPVDVDGYEASVEGEAGAVPDVVTWTATDGGVPAPELPMQAVVDGEAGDELYVRVFQSCDGSSYRWIGTPDDPAEDPAVRLTLTDPDPDAPPPPAATEAETEAEVTPEDAEQATDESATGADDVDASGEADEQDAPTTVEQLPTEPPEGDARDLGWLPVVIGAILLAGLGAFLGTRRRPVKDPAAGDGTGMAPRSDDR